MPPWLDRWLMRIAQPLLERLFWYPRLIEFTGVPTAVVVMRESGGTTCLLQFGPHVNTRPGILFKAKVRLRGIRHSGKLELVQDVVLHREREPGVATSTFRECKTSGGLRMLDETDPYEMLAVSGLGPHDISADDSPQHSLRRSEITRAHDQSRMFLMWRPDRFGGRFRFSMAVIEWWWRGTAMSCTEDEADCTEGQESWKLTSLPNECGAAPAVPTLRRPTTSPNVTTVRNGPWQPC